LICWLPLACCPSGALSIHIYNGSLYSSSGYLSQLQGLLEEGEWFNETVYGTQVRGWGRVVVVVVKAYMTARTWWRTVSLAVRCKVSCKVHEALHSRG
jgi:hypothetical protein